MSWLTAFADQMASAPFRPDEPPTTRLATLADERAAVAEVDRFLARLEASTSGKHPRKAA